jgi:hypothetical protein
MAKVRVDINDLVSTWKDKTNTIANQVGDLTELRTTEDSDLVGAINEIWSVARLDSAQIIGIINAEYFPIDSSGIGAGAVTREKLYNVVNLKIYDSTGVLIKSLYGADSA